MRFITLIIVFVFGTQTATSQSCPANMNFGLGDFTGWQCYVGTSTYNTNCNLPPIIEAVASAPVPGRHTVISSTQNIDPFGGFPITPAGVSHVAKLGAMGQAGGQIERLAYTFTVPANAAQYSLSFLFAIVYQEPNHCDGSQPYFAAKLYDSTDGHYINCFSIEHFAKAGTNGFVQSTNTSQGMVTYKNWTPYTAVLDGYAGHILRLEVTNADCPFGPGPGGHWAYAYLAMPDNIGCGSSTQGNLFCAGTPSTLIGPSGYQSYNWWNSNFTQLLGTGQTFPISATQATSVTYALDLVSYAGTACRDTIAVTIQPNTSVLQASAGPDIAICGGSTSVTIGAAPVTGLHYTWSPVSPAPPSNASQIVVQPAVTTTYFMTATDPVSGCVRNDTVTVFVNAIPAPAISISGNQLTSTAPAGNQWYLNGTAIPGATGQTYTPALAGNYTVIVTLNSCSSPASNTVTYSVTAIDAIMAEWKLQMSPNPTKDRLVISYGGNQKLDLEVLDLTGRRLFSSKNIPATYNVDLSRYLNGSYVVRLINRKTKQEVKKLIIKS